MSGKDEVIDEQQPGTSGIDSNNSSREITPITDKSMEDIHNSIITEVIKLFEEKNKGRKWRTGWYHGWNKRSQYRSGRNKQPKNLKN